MTPATCILIREEIARARKKFPSNIHLLAALTEEVGELAQSLLDDDPLELIQAEAMQVACVAIRIMEEGDGSFKQFLEKTAAADLGEGDQTVITAIDDGVITDIDSDDEENTEHA